MVATLDAADLALVRAELQKPAYAGLSDGQRFDSFHAPGRVPNPVPQGQVPRPFAASDILGLLSTSSAQALESVPFLGTILADIAKGDVVAVGLWANFLLTGSRITQAEHDAILARIAATVPDPNWQATVPGPSPKVAIFGAKTWMQPEPLPDGSVVDFVPLADIIAAR